MKFGRKARGATVLSAALLLGPLMSTAQADDHRNGDPSSLGKAVEVRCGADGNLVTVDLTDLWSQLEKIFGIKLPALPPLPSSPGGGCGPTPVPPPSQPTVKPVPPAPNPTSKPTPPAPKPPVKPTPPAPVPPAPPAPSPAPPGNNVPDARLNEVLKLTNEQRAKAGLSPLRFDTCLAGKAQSWGQHLATARSLSHQDLSAVMYACGKNTAAENVAMGYPDAAAVVNGWMNSPGHRQNILNPSLGTIGLAAVDGASGPYWVQVFGN